MKKVTTNITFGQIFFILIIFIFASLMFFYLGAKFGPGLLSISQNKAGIEMTILPDEKIAQEIKMLIEKNKHEFVFYDALENKKNINVINKSPKKTTSQIYIPDQIIKDVKKASKINKDTIKAKEKVVQKNEKTKLKKEIINAPMKVKVSEPQIIQTANDEHIIDPRFVLQVGSYSKKTKAINAQSVWKKRGFKVNVMSFNNSGKGKWYRLRLGAYANLNDALLAKKKVMKKYRQSARIIDLK
ncbi:hypothetical protein BVY03_02015 [bacterium K02(2017)]|nr:hypothetical protein BVY03_02015 [bacterium K02(2017)]